VTGHNEVNSGAVKRARYTLSGCGFGTRSSTASSGDSGATNHTKSGGYWNKRTASWPAADPNVTAVGGTNSVSGKPNTTLWADSGGGLSKVYARPSWQDSVSKITNSPQRSFPDVAMEGTSGTSESSPLFAAVLALAAQSKGGRLGQVNPALYSGKVTYVDVTSGNNTFNGVTGFAAGKGFDIVSGWGTLDAAKFVPALVKALR